VATVNIAILEAILRLRDEMGPALKKAQENIDKASERLDSFGKGALKAGAGLTAAVTLPLVAIGKSSLEAAMNAVESENLFSVAFGDMSDAARDWSKQLSAAVGSNEFELRKNAATLFSMTSSMGLAKQAAFDMSTGVTALAGDMASFFNLSPDVAFEKIRSGLVGQTEPLRALGILVDDATIKQVAYATGIAQVGAELTQQEKVQARYQAILQQTANAQGDLARTLDSPTNQLRVMGEQMEQLKTELGMALLPVMQSFLGVVRDLMPHIQAAVQWFNSLPEPVRNAAVVVGVLAAALGPLLVVVGSVASGVAALLPLLPALGTAIAVLTGPIGIAVAALVAFAAAWAKWGDDISLYIVKTYDKIKEYLVDKFGAIVDGVKAKIDAVTGFFAKMKDAVVGHSFVPDMIQGIGREFGRLDQVMLNPVQTVIGKVTGLFDTLGKKVTEKLSGIFGGTIGGALGGLIPGIGNLLGSKLGDLASKALSGIGSALGIGGNKVIMQVNDMRDAFFETYGGFEAFSKKMAAVSKEDWAKKIFNAKTVEDFNRLVKEAEGLLGMQAESQEALQAAVEKYGFTVEELGPKFRQQELDAMAGQLLQDYKLLTASGIDYNLVLEKMAPNMSEYIQTAIRAGTSVPEAMRPVIDAMIANGQLLDENGQAYESAEAAGITFAQTMSEQFQSLIAKIGDLVAALTGIPNIDRTVNVNTNYSGGKPPGAGDYAGIPEDYRAASGFHAMVSRPTRILVGESGPERVDVTPRGAGGGFTGIGGGGGIVLQASYNVDPTQTGEGQARLMRMQNKQHLEDIRNDPVIRKYLERGARG